MYIYTIYSFICVPCTISFVALDLISVVSAYYVSMVISRGMYPRESRMTGKCLLEQQALRLRLCWSGDICYDYSTKDREW